MNRLIVALVRSAIVGSLVTACAAPAFAGPTTDAVSTCLTDNTSGKDRKDLARWIFVALGSHPDLKDIVSTTPAQAEDSYRTLGVLVTRLLTENCATQIRAMLQADGSDSMRVAFEFLGKAAIQELMTNEQVGRASNQFLRYTDQAKIRAALAP